MSTPSHSETPNRLKTIRQSRLYKDWYWRVGSGRPNDYIIAISANPRRTGVSGSGKTTFGLNLAKYHFDISESGFDAEVQGTLDPDELAYDIYPETDEGSTLVYDEAQGTPSTTGLNSKRAMKDESLNAINTIATRRKDRKTLIIITQNIKSLVTDLYDYIDAWLLIQDDVNYYATHYSVQPDVFNFESRKTTTPGVEDISWSPVPKSDSDYQYMTKLKDESTERARERASEDDGGELPDDVQAQIAQDWRDQGYSPRWIAEHVESVTYSYSWVYDHTEDSGNTAEEETA